MYLLLPPTTTSSQRPYVVFFLIYCGHQSLQQTALFCFVGAKMAALAKCLNKFNFVAHFYSNIENVASFYQRSSSARNNGYWMGWSFPFLSTGYFSKINVMASSEVKFEIYISILGGWNVVVGFLCAYFHLRNNGISCIILFLVTHLVWA